MEKTTEFTWGIEYLRPDGWWIAGRGWDDPDEARVAAREEFPSHTQWDVVRLAAEPNERAEEAVRRMRVWADNHGEADTQGLQRDEWENLARAALDLPTLEG